VAGGPPPDSGSLFLYAFKSIGERTDNGNPLKRAIFACLIVLKAYFGQRRSSTIRLCTNSACLMSKSTQSESRPVAGVLVTSGSSPVFTLPGKLLGSRVHIEHARTSALTLRLAELLFEHPVLTIPQAEQALGVTYRTAKLNVDKLIEAEILVHAGQSTSGKVFVAREVLHITS
jgi:hypothetical protein